MSKDSWITESSIARTGGVVDGVPRRCWCDQNIKLKLSKSHNNLHRRFFTCSHAAANRLEDDNHVFKWMNEAIPSEIEFFEEKMQSIRREITSSRIEFEKIQRDFETEVFQRVEDGFIETKRWTKKMLVLLTAVFVVGCIVVKIVGSKL